MINNASRIGNITSSEIVAIMSQGKTKGSLGKPALTYIGECNMERRLKRSLDSEMNAKPLSWGKLVEKRVFELLGLEYQLVSQETIVHPSIDYWAGSPDANKFDEGKTVVDIKSPITLKSFCQLVDPLYLCMKEIGGVWQYDGNEVMNIIRENHKDGEKYYWQLVSNAILTSSRFAELIVYAPFKSELQSIRELAAAQDVDLQKYYWINNSLDDELPFLPDGGYYKNLNVIRFEVPPADKIALHERVVDCKNLLITI